MKIFKTEVLLEHSSISVNGSKISVDSIFKSNDVTISKSNSFFYSIEGKGFRILSDSFRIYIRLDPIYAFNTRGLCGTFNFKTSDDFLSQSGLPETDPVSFADSYKIEYNCTTPKSSEPCRDQIAVSYIKNNLFRIVLIFLNIKQYKIN